MCGICGIVSFNNPLDQSDIKKMNNSLFHRGPDGEGYYFNQKVGLGMRRLSIIDLQGGWQPLYNEDQSIVLVLNGEIYNYIELQKYLVTKGHHLSTRCDAETVIHLYEDQGIEGISNLRGMFAFAPFDLKKQLLFIVRDRIGEKPIYLYSSEEHLVFCSELRALYKTKLTKTTINFFAIDKFFHYQYIPEPETPFNEINKLEAGHYLRIDCSSNTVSDHCYWNMTDAPALTGNPVELIKEQLHEVSKIVIRSDVPVGVALSGGLDSSIVAALAMKYYGSKMNAFSVGYEGMPENDERQDARKFADYLGMPFHEIELKTNEIIDFFPTLCGLADDPISDISAFGYYSVSKKARETGVPVLLQGQGGDELFWGYPFLRKALSQSYLKSLMSKYPTIIAFWFYIKIYFPEMEYKAYKRWIKQLGGLVPSIQMFLLHKQFPLNQFPFYEIFSENSVNKNRALYGNDFKEAIHNKNPYQFAERPMPWINPEIILTELITKSYLLENGIAQGDRLSMANSVELRLPLVDYRLYETVIGLRKTYREEEKTPKFWLREATNDIIPEWVSNRRKRGFEPPAVEWINRIVEKYGQKIVNGNLVKNGILSVDAATLIFSKPTNINIGLTQTFSTLVLEYWFENFSKDQ